ncbi:hypothetical protein [Metabacillus indicus]|uniref:hypothetical protein n=1 Tax=Metabacillus indicus TaxID=246786 RepID=UPI003CE6A426
MMVPFFLISTIKQTKSSVDGSILSDEYHQAKEKQWNGTKAVRLFSSASGNQREGHNNVWIAPLPIPGKERMPTSKKEKGTIETKIKSASCLCQSKDLNQM